MPNFQIKFNFEAEEPQELSVAEGEVVSAPAGSEASQEPWTLVETVVPPFNRGFVPTSFLVLVKAQPAGRSGPSSSKASAVSTPLPTSSSSNNNWDNDSQHSFDSQPQQSRKQQQMGNTGPASSKSGSVRRLSDPRLAQQLLNVLAIHPPEEHVGGSGVRQSAANSHQGEYQHLLAQHDRQFQQVMHQRHAQFKALDETALELTRRAEGSKKKANEISTHLLDLTSIVEAERRKWKEKLNEQVNPISRPTMSKNAQPTFASEAIEAYNNMVNQESQ
ncbi:hypothetical protein BASA81_000219 [Batrachochytrium salamandrivorans]|nr:hypothetical protein BASA81_000219 [Batrachochytrium salamandrivorans]